MSTTITRVSSTRARTVSNEGFSDVGVTSDRSEHGASISVRGSSSWGEVALASGIRQYVNRISFKAPHAAPIVKPRVKRRFKGFFLHAEGEEARVALVDNGTLVHYYLPLNIFLDANVKTENQPFELDELELKVDGKVFHSQEIRASAPSEAGFVEPLPFDAEYQEKLRNILRPSQC